MEFLARLKHKPEHERKQIALAATIVIFAAILFLWAALIRMDARHEVAIEDKAPSPFKALGGMLKASISASSASFERAPAPVVDQIFEQEALAGVDAQASVGTTTGEVLVEEGHSGEVLPPPAP